MADGAERDESRWMHLLNPIKDIAANWDVDIAADLSDYLSELEQIEFSFDGGHTTLNFAEGARAAPTASRRARGERASSRLP